MAPKQFLERMTVIHADEGVVLEGLFHNGTDAQPVLLVPGHPRLFGMMDAAPLGEMAWALTRQGHATLRFNFRGVGASTGESDVPPLTERATDAGPIPTSDLDTSYADLCAAIELHQQSAGERAIAVVGYSFGAAVAARAAVEHPDVERAVLVAPPVGRLPFDFEALSNTGIPVTVVCGEADAVASPGDVEAAAGGLRVQVIPHAAHDFQRGLGALGRLVAACFPAAPIG
jgi:alpha/beta superfamily hydrolase